MSLKYEMQESDDEDDSGNPFHDEPRGERVRDDGAYVPSNFVLCLLVLLILLLGGGIGVGTYFAYQELTDNDENPTVQANSPTTPEVTAAPITPTNAPVNPPPSPAPTVAPIDLTPAPEEIFFCSICGEDLDVTRPDAIVSIEGEPDRTCEELVDLAAMGAINSIRCGQLQTQIQETCGCRGPRTEESVLELLESVVGSQVTEPGTSFNEAANWLLNEDTLFAAFQERRRLQDMTAVPTEGSSAPVASEMMGNEAMTPPPSLTPMPSSASSETFPPVPTNTTSSDECHICGEGKEVTINGTINVPGQPIVACDVLDATANNGLLTAEQCALLPMVTAIPCGCQESNVTSAPSPIDFDSNSTTTSPVAAPTGGGSSEDPMLSNISDEALIQRYLVALFYYQTTNNREIVWDSNCTALETQDPENSACDYVTPVRLENGALAEGTPPQVDQAYRWLSAESECDWAGVVCTNGEVEAIFLVQFGIRGTLPTEILMLPQLRWLDFAYNDFSGTIPSDYLASLQNLELNHNNLTGDFLGSEALWANSTIESLNVAANELGGTLPSNINENLQRLFAYSNMLLGTIPTHYLAGDIGLFELDLSDNRLVGFVPTIALGDPEKGVADLNLSKNQLQGVINVDSAKLTSLSLDDNRFLGSIPESLLEARSLVSLSLNGNRFEGPIPDFLGDLIGLSSLEVSGNFLTGTLPSVLGGLTAMEYLDVSNNDLTGSIPPELFALTDLSILQLSRNKLAGTIPTEIGLTTNLVELQIQNNQFGGTIPTEMLRLTDLSVFAFNQNSIVGSLPIEFCDVSYNFDVLRADCIEIVCDCCTECCSNSGVCVDTMSI